MLRCHSFSGTCVPWPSTVNDVLWGAWYRFTLLRRLPPDAFEPAPDVAAGVVAVTADGSILVWGGLNSVHYVRRGERLVGAFQNLAFEDVCQLVRPFAIKNTKAEIDALVEQLKQKYTRSG